MQDAVARTRGEDSVLQMIDELGDLIEDDLKIPFVNRAIWVDVDEFFALTNKIRLALPQEVRRADRFVKDADRLTHDAQAQAAHIVEEARGEADRLVKDAEVKAALATDATEITRAATARAKQIMQDAEEHAQEIKRGADDYARDVLDNLDNYIARVISTVRQGREKLDTKR
jgi:cell division septum initiation protein DivIVA